MRIPLSAPDITESEIEAVSAVLRTPHLSLGPKLTEFEQSFLTHTGLPHAIAVSSGTAGLHLCVLALGLGEGDEVLVPSFTFIAAANVLRYERCTPVFVDIDPESLNMDPAAVERAITPRTRAIMVVHTFGRPAEMNAISDLARRHNLLIIEDACEALGATYQGRQAGTFGHAAVFAFYPNKQITTGEGGMVVTRDPTLAATIRALRNQGRHPSADWLQHQELGYNYRLSDIACALGVEQMKRLPSILDQREQVARLYAKHLPSLPGLVLPALDAPNVRISWFVYVVRLAEKRVAHASTADAAAANLRIQTRRDAIIQSLQARGIGCSRYFAPVHLQPCYSEWHASTLLPVTVAQASRTIALPFFNRLTENQVIEVSAALAAALEQSATE